MSEYKRFVSYIYEYHDHDKGTNRGFMKVECRNGFCLMNFALKGLCQDGNETVDIYGFRRKGSLLEGSLLETVPIQGGTLNYSLRFHADQIGEGNYSMEELAGVIILCKEDFLYATQWDDEPMNFQGFPNHPLTSDVLLDSTDTPSDTPQEDNNIEPNTLPNEHQSEPDTPPDEHPSEPDTPPEENQSESDTHSDEHQSEPDTPSDEHPSESDTPSEASTSEPSTPSPAADIHATSTEPKDFSSQNKPYFRDGSIVNCVRITPKELGKLHPRDWHLTNNRFIHYGYQMFGHLLVGQLADSGQTVLCVPGSYHQRECFMANMFGFSQFIRCPGHKNHPQYFGYWYRSIQPTNLNKGNSPA